FEDETAARIWLLPISREPRNLLAQRDLEAMCRKPGLPFLLAEEAVRKVRLDRLAELLAVPAVEVAIDEVARRVLEHDDLAPRHPLHLIEELWLRLVRHVVQHEAQN